MKETEEAVVPSQVLADIDTDASRVLTQKVKIALIAHFVNAVPIDRTHLDKRTKELVSLVDHVYWIYRRNPMLDTYAMFYQLCKERYKAAAPRGGGIASTTARALERMLDFVIDQVKPDSRRRDEMKVRHAADALMRRGLANDNGRDIAKGAELLTKVARLDQPESEQVDMANAAFLPTVVTTNIHEIDDTREEITDEETKKIMAKYNAFVDDKHKAIEEKVAVMEARGNTPDPQ